MNSASSPTAARTTLYLQRHARMQRVKTISHLVPAVVLSSSILGVVSGEEPLSALLVVEFIVGAAYLVLMVRELLHLHRHQQPHHEPVAWVELAAAGILALEGYHIWHRHHEADQLRGAHQLHLLPWVYWGVAVFYVGMAFGVRHLLERRFLHVHDGGFRGRLRMLSRPFNYEWADVAAVEPAGGADLVIVHQDGRRQRLSFAGLHNGPAQRDELLARIQAVVAQQHAG